MSIDRYNCRNNESESRSIISSLVIAVLESPHHVSMSIKDSFRAISHREPLITINFCHDNFKSKDLTKDKKLILLEIIYSALFSSNLPKNDEWASDLIVTTRDILFNDNDEDILNCASKLMIQLSVSYYSIVFKQFESDKKIGSIPKPIMLRTLVGICGSNSTKSISPTSIYSTVLTFINLIKKDSDKLNLAICMEELCESVIKIIIRPENSYEKKLDYLDGYSDIVKEIINVIYKKWIQEAKDFKIKAQLCRCLGPFCCIAKFELINEYMKDFLQIHFTLMKQKLPLEHLKIVIRSLNSLLEAITGFHLVSNLEKDKDDLVHSDQDLNDSIIADESFTFESIATENAQDERNFGLLRSFEDELDTVLTNCFAFLSQDHILNQDAASGNGESGIVSLVQNEIKHCFLILSQRYFQKTIAFALYQLEIQSSENPKIATLHLLRYLIINCSEKIDIEKRNMIIVSTRKMLLQENIGTSLIKRAKSFSGSSLQNNIKYQLALTVLTMAKFDYLSMSGSNVFLEFMIKEASNHAEPQLQNVCINFFKISSKSIEQLKSVLWPYLIKKLIVAEYSQSISVICDAITNYCSLSESIDAGSKFQAEKDEIQHNNLPSPHSILARLLARLGQYYTTCDGSFSSILKFLMKLSFYFHKNLKNTWDIVIPEILDYLNKNREKLSFCDSFEACLKNDIFDQAEWENQILKLLAKTVEAVRDEEWSQSLEKECVLLISSPANQSLDLNERRFLFKCYGVLIVMSNDEDSIPSKIQWLFSIIKHDRPEDVEGASECIGIMSVLNLDSTLSALNKSFCETQKLLSQSLSRLSIFSSPMSRQTIFSKIFSHKDQGNQLQMKLDSALQNQSNEVNVKHIESTLYWSIGKAVLHGSKDILSSRISFHVLSTFESYLKNQKFKDQNTTISTIGCLSLVAEALTTKINQNAASKNTIQSLKLELVSIWSRITSDYLPDQTLSMLKDENYTIPMRQRSPSYNCDVRQTQAYYLIITCLSQALGNILKIETDSPLSKELETALFHIVALQMTLPTRAAAISTEDVDNCTFKGYTLSPMNTRAVDEDELGDEEERILIRCFSISTLRVFTTLIDSRPSDETVLNNLIKVSIQLMSKTESEIYQHRTLLFLHLVFRKYLSTTNRIRNFSMAGQLVVNVLPHLVNFANDQIRTASQELIKLVIQFMDKSFDINSSLTGLLNYNMTIHHVPVENPSREFWSHTCILVAFVGRMNSQQLHNSLDLLINHLQVYIQEEFSSQSDTTDGDQENGLEDQLTYEEDAWEDESFEEHSDGLNEIINELLDVSEISYNGPIIPQTSLGILIKFFNMLVKFRGNHLEESKVEEILLFLHDIYPKVNCVGLKSGILRVVVKLSYHWQNQSFDVILKQELPLDLVWSIFLSIMVFYPAQSPWITENRENHSNNMQSLLNRTLKILDSCLPYEEREDPMNLRQKLPRKDCKSSKLLTHVWLSAVNALQIISYPLSLTELATINLGTIGYLQNETKQYFDLRILSRQFSEKLHRKSKGSVKLMERMKTNRSKGISSLNTEDVVINNFEFQSHFLSMTNEKKNILKNLRNIDTYPRIMVQWLIVCSICRESYIMKGLNFENRSGTEANLMRNFNPFRIAIDGLRNFLLATRSKRYLFTLGLHENTETNSTRKNRGLQAIRDLKRRKAENILEKSMESQLENLLMEDEFFGIIAKLADLLKFEESYCLLLITKNVASQLRSVYGPIRKFCTTFLSNIPISSLQKAMQCYPAIDIFDNDEHSPGLLGARGGRTLPGFEDQLNKLFRNYLNFLNDKSWKIRKNAVIGLGHFAEQALRTKRISNHPTLNPHGINSTAGSSNCKKDISLFIVQNHWNEAIHGILLGLDDQNDNKDSIKICALDSLLPILSCLTEDNVRSNISAIFTKLLIHFTSLSGEVRWRAFLCSSWLMTFSCSSQDEPLAKRFFTDLPLKYTESFDLLKNQCTYSFIPTFLHMTDKELRVAEECKTAVKLISPMLFGSSPNYSISNIMHWFLLLKEDSQSVDQLLSSKPSNDLDPITTFFRINLRAELKTHFGEISNEFARLLTLHHPKLAKDFVIQTLSYFKSEWEEVQTGAVLFASHLLSHFTEEIRQDFQESHIRSELIKCLKSPYNNVRITAAQALSHLWARPNNYEEFF